MKNQLAVYSALLASIIVLGLLALSGSVLLAATPLLLYLLAADLFRQPEKISVVRALSAFRVSPSTAVEVTVTVVNEGPVLREAIVTDQIPPGLTVTGRPTAAHHLASRRSVFLFLLGLGGSRVV